MVIPISPEYRYFAPNTYLDRRRPEWADTEDSGVIEILDEETC